MNTKQMPAGQEKRGLMQMAVDLAKEMDCALSAEAIRSIQQTARSGGALTAGREKVQALADALALGEALAGAFERRFADPYYLGDCAYAPLVLDSEALGWLCSPNPHASYGSEEEAALENARRQGMAYFRGSAVKDARWDLFVAWFYAAPLEQKSKILSKSKEFWSRLAQMADGGSPVESLVKSLGEKIGLEGRACEFLARFANLSRAAVNVQCDSALMSRLSDANGSLALDAMLALYAQAMGFEASAAEELFADAGPFASAGMLNPDRAGVGIGYFYARQQPRESVLRKLCDVYFIEGLLDAISKGHKDPEKLIGQFAKKVESTDVDFGDFAHLGDELDDLLALVSGRRPADILLWGAPGGGKTTLAQALCKKADKALYEAPRDEKDGASMATDLGSARLSSLKAAQAFGKCLGAQCILVDEAEAILKGDRQKFHLTKALERKDLTRIWIVNELTEVHEAALRRFDMIAHVPPMAAPARLRMAKALFRDQALAARVAQTMRTPAEIRLAKNWCDLVGRECWQVVSRRMGEFQKALAQARRLSQDEFTVEVRRPGVEGEAKAPGLRGFPELGAKLGALAEVFEDPGKYAKFGAGIPRGVLLGGPPGTGKTLFAKVLSERAGVPMVMASSSSLAKDPERIGTLFSQARKSAPCIVFLDEIDALAGSPVKADGSMDLERQKVLNRLLTEMDGFEALDGVMVLGATHRPETLDVAATRSGRFGERIEFCMPGKEDRKEIWEEHLEGAPLSESVSFEALAEASSGFSCADIMESASRGKALSAKLGRAAVELDDLLACCDEVYWGAPAGAGKQGEVDRKFTAYHEAGHALMSWMLGRRIERVTVRPRAAFAGAVQEGMGEGRDFVFRSDAVAKVKVCLAGLAAEEAAGGEGSLGAGSDLAKARQLLWACRLGGLQGSMVGHDGMGMSESMRFRLEEEISGELDDLMQQVRRALAEDAARGALDGLAGLLLEKRELNGMQARGYLESCEGLPRGPEEIVPGRRQQGQSGSPKPALLHKDGQGS